MKVKVRAFGDLVAVIGKEITAELKENATIEDLISKLAEKSGTTKKGYIGPYDLAKQDLAVLINGRNINTLKGKVSLKNGDVVVILPPFIGG